MQRAIRTALLTAIRNYYYYYTFMNSTSGFETKYVIYLSLAELGQLFSKLNV
jgi:hypothetical protein